MIESKEIDKPWKIFLWIIALDGVLKLPLIRFSKPYFSMETLYILSILTTFTFLISVIIVGYLYSKSTNKILEKELRFKSALYVSIFTLVAGLFLAFITAGFFGITESIIRSIINFFIVYHLITIGCKLHRK
ncbi:hypothetical protein HYY74_05675 [Candidatus Woesearchaeota archaeon]|nr:hypothetical protein [Candidatus Woesearchaeota archaeon]